MERDDIPECATALYQNHEMFRKYVANLNLTETWYNEVKEFCDVLLIFFQVLHFMWEIVPFFRFCLNKNRLIKLKCSCKTFC